MKIFGLEISRAKQAPFESTLMRLVAAQEGYWGISEMLGGFGQWITPENCMQSPTVHAIVTAVSRRLSVSPVEVFKQSTVTTDTGEAEPSNKRVRQERQPNHPVAKLLNAPNDWQDRVTYWTDASSRFMRYGNFFAYKNRGSTGPILALLPLTPREVTVQQNLETWAVTYMYNSKEIPAARMHHVRATGRNGFTGDSPVIDIGQSIALEIAAEQFGSSFFRNGALPLMIFRYAAGMQGFKNVEDERKFVEDYQNAVGGTKRHRAMLLPRGIDVGDPIEVQNDKAQFLETRKYQRTVIAGAFGVPPHLVGDLERATFNNVEQQSADFTVNVVMPIARAFEASMERDLLTTADRNGGIIIRFNLDAPQLVDFKSRQEGLLIQRNAGVISANDWRQTEGLNPIPDEDGGEEYWRPLNYGVAGEIPAEPAVPTAPAKPNGAADQAMKQLLQRFAQSRSEIAEALAFADRMGNTPPATVTINMPEQPPAIVHVRPEINVAPPQVTIPVQIEGAQVKVEQAAPQPMDMIPVRGPDGRVTAIQHRPAKKAG